MQLLCLKIINVQILIVVALANTCKYFFFMLFVNGFNDAKVGADLSETVTELLKYIT